ncbi:MAG TPA: P22 phage major capsid protein family protein [Sphingomicrobium sp.]|nr:P22 phage major capsid protein family protein [Sphingomicrobium sp.]
MANSFSKEERVMFDEVLEGFDDQLIIAREVERYTGLSAQGMERSSDRIWRPQPYIPAVYNGFDQSANFGDITGLSVPATVNNVKSSNGKMSPTDLRDPTQLERYGRGAKQTLSSAINMSVFTAAANLGTLVSTRTGAASGFDDLASAGARMTEQGVPMADRKIFYSSRDYLTMAGNIAKPQTSDSPLVRTAFERAYVKTVGNFDVYENDQVIRLTAAAGVTVAIQDTKPLYYTPVSYTTDAEGNTTNVDNRFQTIDITVTSGTVKVGDAFTLATVNAVHHISKQDTGQLKTFRIVEIVSGAGGTGTVKIAPPIISATGGTKAELEYKNVTAAPADGAALTFINTDDANVNPFFVKGAIELLPGTFVVDSSDGWETMKATTPLGVSLSYTRQGNINDLSIKFRWDVRYGVAVLNPEMCGVQLFSQNTAN